MRNIVKVLFQPIIMSETSFYALQCVFNDSHRYNFYDSLINVVIKLREKDIIVIAEDLNGHFASNVQD